ncbi:hypothetical protein JXA47_06855 [Candidatus Sumerlaeota bacterium]|nr:hypothetical protein [Candidatus Sumerlaeota bacterium]
MMIQFRLGILAVALMTLLAATAPADEIVFSDDLENGAGAFEGFRRFSDVPTQITSAPPGHPQAFPPPSGYAALQVQPDPGNEGVGAARGGPIVDRRDASQDSITLEARLYLEPSTEPGQNDFALIAVDDTGTVVGSERYHRFGYRAGTVYCQKFDGANFSPAQTDAALGRSLRVPGWHTFSIRFDGPEEMRFFVDGQETNFSPVSDSEIPRFQIGVLAWNRTGDLPLLADDLRIFRPGAGVEPREIIVNSVGTPAADGSFYIVDGDWDPSTAKSTAEGLSSDGRSLYVDGGEDGTAVFVPNVAATAMYEVFITWSRSANASDVLITVTHADGRGQFNMDQDGWGGQGASNANRWISLGTYRLEAGTSSTVAVTAQSNSRVLHSANVHRTYADAIRIVPADASATTGPPPAPTPVYIPPTRPPTPPPAPAPVVIDMVEVVPSDAVDWRTSLNSARSESRSANRRLAVYAYTPTSRGCQEMEGSTLGDPTAIAALNRAVPVRINLQRDESAAAEFSLYRVPTLILFEPTGAEVGRLVGRFTTQELTELMNR